MEVKIVFIKMQIFNITVFSKNKRQLKIFLKFFKRNLRINFFYINKTFNKKKNKKIITLLKSPHVNKTAQEQFEIKNWFVQFTIYVTQPLKFLTFLKKIKETLFPDLKYKIKNFFRSINKFFIQKKRFSLNQYRFKKILKIKKYTYNSKNLQINTNKNINFLRILELCGVNHTHKNLNSSVGRAKD